MKILGISTTTHSPVPEHPEPSASFTTLETLIKILDQYGHDTQILDANKLHIIKNLSCYSTDKKNCGSLDAGNIDVGQLIFLMKILMSMVAKTK